MRSAGLAHIPEGDLTAFLGSISKAPLSAPSSPVFAHSLTKMIACLLIAIQQLIPTSPPCVAFLLYRCVAAINDSLDEIKYAMEDLEEGQC